MSGHFELGEIIKNHKDSDVGKLSCQTVSSEGATKCCNLFPTPAFLCIFLNLSCICPYNVPSFSLNNLPNFSLHFILSHQTPLPLLTSYSSLLVTSEPSPVNLTHSIFSALFGIAKVCSHATRERPHPASPLTSFPPPTAR